jgi:DNA-binding transcriptional LysR family regulator
VRVDLRSLDLNLLVTLDTLLKEVSVTRAAHELGVSQPAVSAALRRLRRHFDDQLLRRTGNTYALTPLATQLKEHTGVAIHAVQRVFEASPAFDPAAGQREFRILSSDYAMAVLGEALGTVLDQQAPGVRIYLEHHTPAIVDHAAEHLRVVDGVLMPHGFLSGLSFTDLYEDGWMCLVSTTNRRVGDELTMQLLAELPWAFTYFSPAAFTPAGRQLQILGVEPRVQIVVESFLALPFVVAGTDRIALVQSQLVPRLTASGDVRALPCPFDAVPIAEALWWHPMYERDPAHVWLRRVLAQAGRQIASRPIGQQAVRTGRTGLVVPGHLQRSNR